MENKKDLPSEYWAYEALWYINQRISETGERGDDPLDSLSDSAKEDLAGEIADKILYYSRYLWSPIHDRMDEIIDECMSKGE